MKPRLFDDLVYLIESACHGWHQFKTALYTVRRTRKGWK
jgi:hypothetical protein